MSRVTSAMRTAPALCLLLLWMASCKPQGINANGPIFGGSFYAIVDGSGFTGTNNSATVSDTILSVTASGADTATGITVIKLNIGKYKGVATYLIDSATSASYQQRDTLYGARSGRIVVTTASGNHVVGSFTFIATRPGGAGKNVSAGRFELFQ